MSNTDEFRQVIERRQKALREPASLGSAITALQGMVWHAKDWEPGVPGEIAEQLRDLAHDLDHYPEDLTEDRALQEIAAALVRIERANS